MHKFRYNPEARVLLTFDTTRIKGVHTSLRILAKEQKGRGLLDRIRASYINDGQLSSLSWNTH